MNVQVKQGVYCMNVWNLLASDIGLEGHYTVVYDSQDGSRDGGIWLTKFADYGNMVSYVEVKATPLQPATPEQAAFFLPRIFRRIDGKQVNPPMDLEGPDCWPSLRAIYADSEALIDSYLTAR